MAAGEGVGYSGEEKEVEELGLLLLQVFRDWLAGVIDGHDLFCIFCIYKVRGIRND